MLELLPKARWAPMPGVPHNMPPTKEQEFGKSELEKVFEDAKVRYDVAEVGVLVYDTIEDLPSACKPKRWNNSAMFTPIASFPSVGAACWFLAHLESIQVYQDVQYATQSDSKSEPSTTVLTIVPGWQVYNEHKKDGNPLVNGGKTPMEGWDEYCWWKRSYIPGQKQIYVSENEQDSGLPTGVWHMPSSLLRVAWGVKDGDWHDYGIDLSIHAIVWADDKAWLIGNCAAFPYWINLYGREGCIFTSSYFETAEQGHRGECVIETPCGSGAWYYTQFDCESQFKVDGVAMGVPTGAKEAEMIFTFV